MLVLLFALSSWSSYAGGRPPAEASIKICTLKAQPVFYARIQETTAWTIEEIVKLPAAPEGDPFVAIVAAAVDLIKALDFHLSKTALDKTEFIKKMTEINEVALRLSRDGRHTTVERDLLRAIIRFTKGMINRADLSFAAIAEEASWTYGFIYRIEVPQFNGISEGQVDRSIRELKITLQSHFFKVSEGLGS